LARVRGGKMSAELRVLKKNEVPHDKSAELWLLDETGTSMKSRRWAETFSTAADSGVRRIILFVGPAQGVPKQVKEQAKRIISLGSATMPSWLACLVAAEQIYRSDTIQRNTPYHND